MVQTNAKKLLLQWGLVIAFLGISTFLVGTQLVDFQANVISQQVKPFDGTVPPVSKVPNWVLLNPNDWNLEYSQIPQDKFMILPTYNPNVLKIPLEQLDWNKEMDKPTFNAKITYPVPYMGNYDFDGLEYAGSHLGIDIKLPKGTPINAIGNGVVTQVSLLSTGFGYHLIIRHDNFPSFNNPNILTTYYSTYSHLSSVLVSEGDVVTKGQQIALSGQTGAATIAHLHFQIDNDDAPWHPYWPFTFEESNALGYDMHDAINAGLGKEKAIALTINPLMYIQQYRNDSGIAAQDSTYPNLRGSALSTDVATESVAAKVSATTQPKAPFRDVVAKGEAAEALSFLKKHEILLGYKNGTFKPKKILSKVEALKLTLMSGNKELESGKGVNFQDVSTTSWYAPYIATAIKNGLIRPSTARIFRPFEGVSRASFFQMLFIAMDMKPTQNVHTKLFEDVPQNASYAPYIQFAKEKNLLIFEGKFMKPKALITREEAAIITYRALTLKISGQHKYSTDLIVLDQKANEYFKPYTGGAK